ncbi:hypothetical protein [Neorhizobium alkalisoli]|uniref:hypothetical protein n=1 Tax=Neorhizobium alkalisoli TaxID=528178 RepID=UPI000CF97CF8|nr:hypothetical protein [Neorhizobium alkalisoli]
MAVIRQENSVETGGVATAFPPLFVQSRARWAIVALASIAVCTLTAALAAVLVPGARPLLLQEDGIIEMASVACLASAVIGAAVASATWKGLHLPLLVAGLIGFAELMDETSFGSRLVGFHPPALYGGGELDGFHDLLILAYRLLRDIHPALAWVWVGLLLAASIGMMMFALSQLGREIDERQSWLADHFLIFLHVGFIGLAQVIDVATESKMLSAVEEMFEFNASLALLFYVAHQAHRSRKKTAIK